MYVSAVLRLYGAGHLRSRLLPSRVRGVSTKLGLVLWCAGFAVRDDLLPPTHRSIVLGGDEPNYLVNVSLMCLLLLLLLPPFTPISLPALCSGETR